MKTMPSYRWYIALIFHIKSVPAAGCEELAERHVKSVPWSAGPVQPKNQNFLTHPGGATLFYCQKKTKKEKNPAASGKRKKLPWIILCLPVTKQTYVTFPGLLIVGKGL